MKKLLALVLVLVMAFSCLVLASCGDKKEESSTASENSTAASADESKAEESATSTEEPAASADESAASEEATSEDATSEDTTSEDTTSEEVTSEEATSEDVSTEVPEEIKATATYKFFQKVNAIDTTNGVSYMMVMDGEEMAICILGDKVYAKLPASIIGADMTVIIKDGFVYSLNEAEKTYAVSEGNPYGDVSSLTGLFDEISSFNGYEFVSTTTEEVEGVTYTVETFKEKETEEIEKYYIDADGNVVTVIDSEGTTELEFDGEGLVMTNGEDVVGFGAGVIDGCFDIPADYTEAPAVQ